jgi:hypothetical protein
LTCDRCGVEIQIGDFPFCPHGAMRAGRGADVTWPGGRTFENLGDRPVTFYSPTEQARYLKAHGIESVVRHAPVPGSDKSPHTTSWASGLPQEYLDGVAAMLARVGTAGDNRESSTYVKEMAVTITDVIEPVRGSVT